MWDMVKLASSCRNKAHAIDLTIILSEQLKPQIPDNINFDFQNIMVFPPNRVPSVFTPTHSHKKKKKRISQNLSSRRNSATHLG